VGVPSPGRSIEAAARLLLPEMYDPANGQGTGAVLGLVLGNNRIGGLGEWQGRGRAAALLSRAATLHREITISLQQAQTRLNALNLDTRYNDAAVGHPDEWSSELTDDPGAAAQL